MHLAKELVKRLVEERVVQPARGLVEGLAEKRAALIEGKTEAVALWLRAPQGPTALTLGAPSPRWEELAGLATATRDPLFTQWEAPENLDSPTRATGSFFLSSPERGAGLR